MFKNKFVQFALLLGILFLGIGLPLAAQSYNVRGRPVIAAEASTGGGYALSSTIGQPEVGSELSGGGFSLSGGLSFRGSTSGSSSSSYAVYLPLIIK